MELNPFFSQFRLFLVTITVPGRSIHINAYIPIDFETLFHILRPFSPDLIAEVDTSCVQQNGCWNWAELLAVPTPVIRLEIHS